MTDIVDTMTREKLDKIESKLERKDFLIKSLDSFDLEKIHFFVGVDRESGGIALLAPQTDDVKGLSDFYVLMDVTKDILMKAIYQDTEELEE